VGTRYAREAAWLLRHARHRTPARGGAAHLWAEAG